MSADSATIHIDGASRGNPGAAAIAYVIAIDDGRTVEAAERIGTTTNNIAEYTALVRALRAARDHGLHEARLFSDSELLVKQMNGAYRVKNEDLKALYNEAKELSREFTKLTFTHVRRSNNQRADELCNQALDGHTSTTSPKPRLPQKARYVSDDTVRDDAIACLTSAAHAWATHGANEPNPADIWEQLWSILEEGNVLRRIKSK